MDRGVRKGDLAVGDQAADVVAVHVRDQHRIDLLRLVAGGGEVGEQVAERRPEQLGRAGVDQHQLVAGVHQIGVDRGRHRFRLERALQQALDLLGRGVGEELARMQVEDAVAERGDLEIAEHHPVEAGRLGLDLRRARARPGGEKESAEEGGQGGAERAWKSHGGPREPKRRRIAEPRAARCAGGPEPPPCRVRPRPWRARPPRRRAPARADRRSGTNAAGCRGRRARRRSRACADRRRP